MAISSHYVINFYLNIKIEKNQFIEYKKHSKSLHLLKNYIQYDNIFIGSSSTQYHISQNEFKKEKISIYNYGVSGQFIYNYPYMVHNAIKLKPKKIIISLNPIYLFSKNQENHTNFRGIKFIDFIYVLKTHPVNDTKKAFMEMIKNIYLPFEYSQNINSKIYEILDKLKLNIKKNFNKSNLEKIDKITNNTNDNTLIDCKPFFEKKGLIINCTNGDGILLSTAEPTSKSVKKITLNIDDLNYNRLNMLNILSAKIKKNNIEALIILEPLKDKELVFNKKTLQELIEFKLIDATKFKTDNQNWADQGHMNNKGRLIYSKFLIKKLN